MHHLPGFRVPQNYSVSVSGLPGDWCFLTGGQEEDREAEIPWSENSIQKLQNQEVKI
jgi:hypothetical protein